MVSFKLLVLQAEEAKLVPVPAPKPAPADLQAEEAQLAPVPAPKSAPAFLQAKEAKLVPAPVPAVLLGDDGALLSKSSAFDSDVDNSAFSVDDGSALDVKEGIE